MFEKEAEEIAKDIYIHHFDDDVNYPDVLKAITVGVQKGAAFGYNKANEWHWIKDGDFPEEEKEYLIYTKKKKLEIRKIHISGDGKNYLTDVFLMRDLESVIAWKEIVPPELKE